MNQETLDIIGKTPYCGGDKSSAFYLARECGFDNINMDLIVGLPGRRSEKVQYTLDEIKRMAPDSITVHSLAVKGRQG